MNARIFAQTSPRNTLPSHHTTPIFCRSADNHIDRPNSHQDTALCLVFHADPCHGFGRLQLRRVTANQETRLPTADSLGVVLCDRRQRLPRSRSSRQCTSRLQTAKARQTGHRFHSKEGRARQWATMPKSSQHGIDGQSRQGPTKSASRDAQGKADAIRPSPLAVH
jgi:hypothetical protein